MKLLRVYVVVFFFKNAGNLGWRGGSEKVAWFWGGEVSRGLETTAVQRHFDFSSRVFTSKQHTQQLSKMPPASWSEQQEGITFTTNFTVCGCTVSIHTHTHIVKWSWQIWPLVARSPQQAARRWWAGSQAHLRREKNPARVRKTKSRPRPNLLERFNNGFREPRRNQEEPEHVVQEWLVRFKWLFRPYFTTLQPGQDWERNVPGFIFIIAFFFFRSNCNMLDILFHQNVISTVLNKVRNKGMMLYSRILLPLLLEKTFWNDVDAMHLSY